MTEQKIKIRPKLIIKKYRRIFKNNKLDFEIFVFFKIIEVLKS